MTTVTTSRLKTALGPYPHLRALRDGRVTVPGIEFDHVEVKPDIIAAFRRMCRTLEFDVSEMAVVTYFVARHYGLPMTAIPVVVSASVHDGRSLVYNENAGVRVPKDLEGKKVGLRAYTVTGGVWARGFLAEQGVDLDKVTWVLGDDEHVEAYMKDAPANVEYRMGADLKKLLVEGEVAGGIQIPAGDPLYIKEFFPNADAKGIETFQRTGVYRLSHLVVIKDSVIAEHPDLPRNLFNALKASKSEWLATLAEPPAPHQERMLIGMPALRKSLEALMNHAVAQKVLPRPLDLDAIFEGGD
jgi:4,5-dihydroxyphthalate decarboxylase